jgi:drug/metabolite transporter (DMT)-like permease
VILLTANTVLGQLLLKRALVSLGGAPTFDNLWQFAVDASRSPWIYLSIAVQGMSYLLWMLLISRTKLGIATASVGAGFYTLTPLLAWLVYGETLTIPQWLGIGFIAVGVTCVSLGAG